MIRLYCECTGSIEKSCDGSCEVSIYFQQKLVTHLEQTKLKLISNISTEEEIKNIINNQKINNGK